MPKAKYDHIYRDLKEKIETEFYAYQQMLPSENAFVKEYGFFHSPLAEPGAVC